MASVNDSAHNLLYWCNLISTLFSLAGSFWMSYRCLKTPAPRTTALKLILAIAISDLIYSFCNLLSSFNPETEDSLCKLEGFLREFSAMLTIFFSTSTAILCYLDTTVGGGFHQHGFFRKAFWVSFSLSMFLSISPLFGYLVVYKKLSLFCWVGSASSDPSLFENIMIITFYEGIPLIVGLIICFFGYWKAIRNITGFAQIYLAEVGIQVYKLLWYPAVLFIIFIPSLIDNILAFCKLPIPLWLQATHLVLTHSIGFANALVYGLQRPKSPPKVQDCQISMREGRSASSSRDNSRHNSITEDLIRASTVMKDSPFEVI